MLLKSGPLHQWSITTASTLILFFQLLVTLGYLGSTPIQAKLDCKYINIIFLTLLSMSMAGMGLSFLYPDMLGSYVSIPCLVVAGACYGLGVGPACYVIMSSIFTQKNKSVGVMMSKITRTASVLAQMKV